MTFSTRYAESLKEKADLDYAKRKPTSALLKNCFPWLDTSKRVIKPGDESRFGG
jgi:hypothetical protein